MLSLVAYPGPSSFLFFRLRTSHAMGAEYCVDPVMRDVHLPSV